MPSTQEVLPTPVGRKYSTRSSLLTSSPSMTLTHPPFSIAPLAVTSPFPLFLCPFLLLGGASGPSDHLPIPIYHSANERPASFNAGMGLPPTLSFTVHLQRNTRVFLFPLLLLYLPFTECSSIPFATSNALLKPGGLLRWKKRLVKDARLSLPLTEVIKIAKLTSPLLDAPRQSWPRPRLRHLLFSFT